MRHRKCNMSANPCIMLSESPLYSWNCVAQCDICGPCIGIVSWKTEKTRQKRNRDRRLISKNRTACEGQLGKEALLPWTSTNTWSQDCLFPKQNVELSLSLVHKLFFCQSVVLPVLCLERGRERRERASVGQFNNCMGKCCRQTPHFFF